MKASGRSEHSDEEWTRRVGGVGRHEHNGVSEEEERVRCEVRRCSGASGSRQCPRVIAFSRDALDSLFLSCIIRTAPFGVLKRVVVVDAGRGIEVSNGRGAEVGRDDGADGDDSGVDADRRARRGRCRRPRRSAAAST